jgi:hypothetical protein
LLRSPDDIKACILDEAMVSNPLVFCREQFAFSVEWGLIVAHKNTNMFERDVFQRKQHRLAKLTTGIFYDFVQIV